MSLFKKLKNLFAQEKESQIDIRVLKIDKEELEKIENSFLFLAMIAIRLQVIYDEALSCRKYDLTEIQKETLELNIKHIIEAHAEIIQKLEAQEYDFNDSPIKKSLT